MYGDQIGWGRRAATRGRKEATNDKVERKARSGKKERKNGRTGEKGILASEDSHRRVTK